MILIAYTNVYYNMCWCIVLKKIVNDWPSYDNLQEIPESETLLKLYFVWLFTLFTWCRRIYSALQRLVVMVVIL